MYSYSALQAALNLVLLVKYSVWNYASPRCHKFVTF